MRASALALEPLELADDLGAVAGVADHAETAFGLRNPIDEHVVEHAALVIDHQAVLDLLGIEPRDLVGGGAFQPGLGVGPLEAEPAHVADVEEPGPLADGLVLLRDRRVLHRHRPAAELHHPAAVRDVPGV